MVRLFTTVENTGTVTTTVRGGTYTIRDTRGDVVDRISFGSHALPPNSQKTLQKSWTGPDIEGGQYQLSGELDYVSDEASITGELFSIPDAIEVVPDNVTAGGTAPADREPFPLPLILMVLALLGVLMYSFEVDPFWIVAIVGFLGVSAFIIGTGIPDYTIAILLMVAGGLYYIS